MRLPEPLFPILNRIMRLLLHSPLHGLMSGSIMVVTVTGRRSGKRRAFPVRYLREDDGRVICFTSPGTGWWRNFADGRSAELLIAGKRLAASGRAWPGEAEQKEGRLRRMLTRFPSDAAYHDIVVGRGEVPSDEQIEEAAQRDVLVVFTVECS